VVGEVEQARVLFTHSGLDCSVKIGLDKRGALRNEYVLKYFGRSDRKLVGADTKDRSMLLVEFLDNQETVTLGKREESISWAEVEEHVRSL
jgi:hypothetical protein